jgi:serine/threonine protein kinase
MVLLAEDVNLRRMAAIKIMLPRYAKDPQARERFLREARAAAKIKHDNVITIHQVDEANDVPFIAMEFLKGEPLDRYLKDKGELSIGQPQQLPRPPSGPSSVTRSSSK